MFVQDFVINNGGIMTGEGPVAEFMEGVQFNTGLLRPFLDPGDGNRKACLIRNQKGEKEIVRVTDLMAAGIHSPVFNATSLRKEEWIKLDEVVLRAARYRLRAWADLAAANSYGGFNGMATTILEHETMTDPGEAQVDMDGLAQGRNDAPQWQLEGIPLPITHSDFFISARKLAASRQRGDSAIDSIMAEVAARRVAESVEKTTIGTNTGLTYGGTNTAGTYGRTSKVYGYTNFSNRLTYTSVRNPSTTPSWTASMTLADVLAMRDLLRLHKFTGPYMLYHSNDWDQYMDNDYILTGGNVATQTLRNRLRAIDGIQDVRRLDFMFATAPTQRNNADKYDALNPFTLLLVQMTPDVCRAVNGMDITTVQWESQGGMRINFKVMCIQVPQLRADNYGDCGLCHGTTS